MNQNIDNDINEYDNEYDNESDNESDNEINEYDNESDNEYNNESDKKKIVCQQRFLNTSMSEEQQNVVESLLNFNVIVDSVAGSGKTTCSLFIASTYCDKKILQLTYNSKLKLETREKVAELGIKNLEVHSYHSFCVKSYDRKCFTDSQIKQVLKEKKPPLRIFEYDLIILDETQDMSFLYYELFCKIYCDNLQKKGVKICIFGDMKQSIFDFNGADERFIVLAEKLFNFDLLEENRIWKRCKLSRSFRVTDTMSLFLNHCLLNEDRIFSQKISAYKPRYIICNCFGDVKKNRVFDEVKYYLDMGYLSQDIFILAPSCKNIKFPVRMLENKIKRELPEIPVYVPTSDDEKLDKDILEGKLVFSTFHQTKGLERKVVIVFNIDDSYFEFFKRETNPFICPNELYVSCTRALEHLTLLHHYQRNYLPFLNKDNLEIYCDFEIHKPIKLKESSKQNLETSPTQLTKHLSSQITDECFNLLKIKCLSKEKEKINIPLKTIQVAGHESVSEITGIAIPAIFEYKIKGNMDIFTKLKKIDFEQEFKEKKKLKENESTCLLTSFFKKKVEKDKKVKSFCLKNINLETITPEEILYIANCWNSFKSGYLFKICQIKKYDWLSHENLIKCVERMESCLTISREAHFERSYRTENEKELMGRQLNGFVDCIDENNVYEFKCVQKLEKEHYLQLAIYMYQIEMNSREKDVTNETNYYLFNILTDELQQVFCDLATLKHLMDLLIRHKYSPSRKISESAFMEKNFEIQTKYFERK